jgi:hypothetical protein
MSDETLEMHKYFSDWMRPAGLGTDREALVFRWQTISRIVQDDVNLEKCHGLIKYSFGDSSSVDELEWFQNEFKKDDVSFSMIEEVNRTELRCLAGIVLCIFLEYMNENSSDIGTRVLSVEFLKLRELIGCAPVVQLSVEAIQAFGVEGRKRPKVTEITNLSTKKTFDEAFTSIVSGQWDTYASAIKVVYDTSTRRFNHLAKASNNSLDNLKKFVDVQDEELEMLWWLINSQSKKLDCPFNSLDVEALSTVAGIEIADNTALDVEIPSLEAFFNRTIPDSDKKSIESIVTHSFDYLEQLISIDDYCDKYITPCHYSLKCLIEVGKEAWREKIEEELGLSMDVEVSLVDWAMQICRERLIIKMN